jgi:hypothetical protein
MPGLESAADLAYSRVFWLEFGYGFLWTDRVAAGEFRDEGYDIPWADVSWEDRERLGGT